MTAYCIYKMLYHYRNAAEAVKRKAGPGACTVF